MSVVCVWWWGLGVLASATRMLFHCVKYVQWLVMSLSVGHYTSTYIRFFSLSFQVHSRSVIRNDHSSLTEVLPSEHIQKQLPTILDPADEVLLVLDLASRDAVHKVRVELFDVLGAEARHDEAVEVQLEFDHIHQVLDGVGVLVVSRDHAAFLQRASAAAGSQPHFQGITYEETCATSSVIQDGF